MKVPACLIALTIALGATGMAQAEAFYCGNRIVDKGTRADQVLSWCGQPIWVDRTVGTQSFSIGLGMGQYSLQQLQQIYGTGAITVQTLGGISTATVLTETYKWTYAGGSGTLPRFIWIENGIVTDAKTGQY